MIFLNFKIQKKNIYKKITDFFYFKNYFLNILKNKKIIIIENILHGMYMSSNVFHINFRNYF